MKFRSADKRIRIARDVLCHKLRKIISIESNVGDTAVFETVSWSKMDNVRGMSMHHDGE